MLERDARCGREGRALPMTQRGVGGAMRLSGYSAVLQRGSRVSETYSSTEISDVTASDRKVNVRLPTVLEASRGSPGF